MKTISFNLLSLLLGLLLHTSYSQAQSCTALNQAEKTNYSGHSIDMGLLKKQLQKHISFPAVMEQPIENSLVVVDFQLSATGEVCQVKVHSLNEVFNTHIVRCLEGLRLNLSHTIESDFRRVYRIRLHFKQA